MDPLSWVYRVQTDELSILARASANYATRGHDPLLAAEQARARARAQPPEAATTASALSRSSASRRSRSAGATQRQCVGVG